MMNTTQLRASGPTRVARSALAPAPTPREPLEQGALRSVSSGPDHGGHSCERLIPHGLVLAAWHAAGEREGFFEVDWCGGTWVSYGRSDGTVAGAYCPGHARARAARRRGANHAEPIVTLRRAA